MVVALIKSPGNSALISSGAIYRKAQRPAEQNQ
jgi:hypothetical protein